MVWKKATPLGYQLHLIVSRIVMEHTGPYYEVLAHQLSEANLFAAYILVAFLFCWGIWLTYYKQKTNT